MKDFKDKVAGITSASGCMGCESIKEAELLPKVELHIHPPLSYKMSSKKVGPLLLKTPIEQGDTLGDLLVRLDKENHDAWRDLFDAQTKKMRPPIRTILNGNALSPSVLAHTPLSDGDQISFLLVYGGG